MYVYNASDDPKILDLFPCSKALLINYSRWALRERLVVLEDFFRSSETKTLAWSIP